MSETEKSIFDGLPMYLKVDQVAKIMGSSIPYTKLGSMRVQKYDLKKWLEEHCEYGVVL